MPGLGTLEQRLPTRLGAHVVNVHSAFRAASEATAIPVSRSQRTAMRKAIDAEVEQRMAEARRAEAKAARRREYEEWDAPRQKPAKKRAVKKAKAKRRK